MRTQKGFTLVELMVVMAIIAILATAGIAQYGRFIKSARDTTRIADIQSINVVILNQIQTTGKVPANVAALTVAMEEVAGKKIVDPLGTAVCLGATSDSVVTCDYRYAPCDGDTGYVIGVSFEAPGNVAKYAKDDIGGTYAGSATLYEVGSCNTVGTFATIM